MDAHIRKVYVPMTETAFYILLCLKTPNNGYGIVQTVERLTEGAIKLAPGTMYGSLSKMEKDGLIRFVREEEKRKIYEITDLGREVLQTEIACIERLYRSRRRENNMETKKAVKFFSVVDWEKEQNYLREMHRQGWKFVRLTALGVYHFEKCEPEDVIYQLDYNADGLAHKEEYVQLFADCGWEYLQDYLGYRLFP